jgi:hypothetical protein
VGTVVDCDAVGSSYRCYLTAACGEWGVPFLGRSIRIDRLDRMDAMVLEARKGTEALLPLLVTGEGGQRLYVLEAWENVFAAQADRALPPDRELLIRPVPPATGAGDGEAPLRPEDLP